MESTDIWMQLKKVKISNLIEYKSILELKAPALLSLLNDKDLVGISLKKSEGNPKLKYINVSIFHKNRMMYEHSGVHYKYEFELFFSW